MRKKVAGVVLFVGLAVLTGLVAPLPGAGAWPWDKGDQEVELTGLVQCAGFDLSPAGKASTAPKANPVEWLTIRGVSDPLLPGHTAIRSYRAKVKVGWKVEYTLKCKNSRKIDRSFTVGKRAVGSSARQTRHICEQQGLEPCTVPELGACGLAIVQGAIDLPVDLADWVLDQVESGVPIPGVPSKLGNHADCANAVMKILRNRTPDPAYNAVPVPTIPPPPDTIPKSVVPPTLGTLPTIPVPPPSAAPAQPPATTPNQPPAVTLTQPPAAAPSPTTAPVAPPPRIYRIQQATRGADTFQNPQNASGQGPKVAPRQWIDVYCKVKPPSTIDSANPDGYWYRIASAPWNGNYYAVANTFWNGDVEGQKPYTHNTDFSIPDC